MDYQKFIDKTEYTASEKDQIAAMFKKAEQNGLPVSLLANKVKEAGLKRVRFNALSRVMEQRLSMMTEANESLSGKKIPIKNKQYALEVLTELQEKGVKRQTYEKILNAAAAKGKDFDDTAKYLDALGKYRDDNIPEENYADIISACIGKGVSAQKSEKLLYMLMEAKRGNMPLEAAKEQIMNGIAQNKRVEEIGDDINFGSGRKGRITENEDRQRVREDERTRGISDGGSSGQAEAGGSGTRRGR
jgi:hypothetical protein